MRPDLMIRCTGCGDSKPVAEFYAMRRRRAPHVRARCKVCTRREQNVRDAAKRARISTDARYGTGALSAIAPTVASEGVTRT